jgi:hypothetical protein
MLSDDWTSFPDNDFAAGYFTTVGWDRVRPTPSEASTGACNHFYSSASVDLFGEVCDLAVLQDRAKACDLCSILLESLNRKGLKTQGRVNLRTDAAHVGLKDGPNLLSLYCAFGEMCSICHCYTP